MTGFADIEARVEAITADAVRLRDGTHAAWFPLATLSTAARKTLDTAAIGDRVALAVQSWKLAALGWPDRRDRRTADLFGAPEGGPR